MVSRGSHIIKNKLFKNNKISGLGRNFSSSTEISTGESLNEQDPRDSVSNFDFYEFFRGLSDGESNFQITQDHRGKCNFKFKFRIGMHINDRPLLVYIRNRLGFGKIFPISIEGIFPTPP